MTKILGLIGYPLAHSFSKKYFTQKFEKEKIKNFRYENYPLKDINDLPNLLKQNPQIIGLNVTIPYKQSVLKFVENEDEIVKKTGATNTLVISFGRIVKAYNTDVYGFCQSFKKNIMPQHKSALILGTGGASRSVAYVLEQLKIPYLYVSRNPKNKQTISYNALDKNIILSHQIIINTTPVGTYPNFDEKPFIPYDFITKNHYFYDLIYNPSKTLFLKEAEKRGAIVCNGLEMLKLQAAKAWKIWNKKSS